MRSRGNQVVESKNGVLDRGVVVHVTRGGCVKHVVASRGARIHVRHGGRLRRCVCVAGDLRLAAATQALPRLRAHCRGPAALLTYQG